MDKTIDIRGFFRTCESCKHSDGSGTCRRPGGWWWDEKFQRCACFERREAAGDPF